MQVFVRKPSIDLYPGLKVDKDTVLEYKNENVEQRLENLTLYTKAKVKGNGYESVCETTIWLQEGDVLLLEEDSRGYIKPVDSFVTAEEAIEDFRCIANVGCE